MRFLYYPYFGTSNNVKEQKDSSQVNTIRLIISMHLVDELIIIMQQTKLHFENSS